MSTLPIPRHVLFVPVVLALVAPLHAQSANGARTSPALGLLRLKSEVRSGEAAPLAEGKYNVDDLSAAGTAGATKGRRDNADYLALDAGKSWARPLRGSSKEVAFVSFQAYASKNTIIEIGGARLGLTIAPFSGRLQLMFDTSAGSALQWKALNSFHPLGKYGGNSMAEMPTLTVRIDPSAGVWDIFVGARLLAGGLPLIANSQADRRFVYRAGDEGAWLSGLVMADENPIYEDANANGIDDAFERKQRGSLLPGNATKADQERLAKEWQESQRTKPPPAFFVVRPLPDDARARPPRS